MSYPTVPFSACAEAKVPLPLLPGAEILSLTAKPVLNYTNVALEMYNYNHPTIRAEGVDFCNITVTYTHPGQEDSLGVETWLPLSTWNGRIQSVGGGGWSAGRFFLSYQSMTGAIAEGYVTSSIDAGLADAQGAPALAPDDWAMISEGNVNLYNLQNLASVSLRDQAVLVKALTENFYGQKHEYAYWSGCSQGGRQGMMLAQRYPDAYDGIAAAAPAFYWSQFIFGTVWAQVIMRQRGEYPPPCEFQFITDAIITACDPLDGIVDGLLANEEACHFDPMTLVGQQFMCSDTGKMRTLSETSAIVAAAAWNGPETPEGQNLWPGVNPDSLLSGSIGDGSSATTAEMGYAQTVCQNGTCTGLPLGLGDAWIPLFVQKNSSETWENVTPDTFTSLLKRSIQEYSSIIDTSDPDLQSFRTAGGKMITYHGTADEKIPFKQTVRYYNEVLAKDPKAHEFYRFFEVPGLAHCADGNGGQPTAVWESLVAWVENGTAPDTMPIEIQNLEGEKEKRQLFPYPRRPYSGASPNNTSCRR